MTTDNYDPAGSLSAYYPSRAGRVLARIWAREKTLHDWADLGAVQFFEGGGSDPTVLTGYATNKLWLRVDEGVTDESATVHYYAGGTQSSLSSWPELDRNGFSAHIGARSGGEFDLAWSTATSGDPGTGMVRGNHATLASITSLAISKTGRQGQDYASRIAAWRSADSVRIYAVGDGSAFVDVVLTSAPSDQTTYYVFTCSVNAASTLVSGSLAGLLHIPTSASQSDEWAIKTDGSVDGADYSAKAWAIGGTGVTNTSGRGAAKEWAIAPEDDPVDGSGYSALHYAAKAAASAAGVNMPGISAGDARKLLVVKSDETGFGLKARRKRCLLAYGQSNIANTGAVAWSPRDNLMLWNGGYWNGALLESEALGDAFEPAPNGTVSVPLGWADHLAAIYPEDDLYLVVIARGGTGVKAVVGQRYTWSTTTAGDPGTGAIGGNNATPASISDVRYSETDAEGYVRFLGLSDLVTSATYKARIEVVGDEENTWLEFAVTGAYTDNGTWRNQAVTYSGSANWPPANGTPVRVFESYPRMKGVLHDNIAAAFDAIGLTGADRKFDHILLWPTESDLNYVQAYEGVDFPRLLNELEDYYDIDAEWVFPLPFPYGAGIAQQLDSWWSSVRRIVAANEMRRVVDLTDTGASNWTDANNIHVAAAGMLPIGRSIARNAERGGSPLNTLGSGSYTPTLTGVVNVDSLTPVACNWLRVGNQVVVSGQMAVNPTTAGNTLTQVSISLPVASDVWITTLVSGVATSMSLAGVIGWVTADIANDAAILNFKANSDANQNLMFSFQYVVVSA